MHFLAAIWWALTHTVQSTGLIFTGQSKGSVQRCLWRPIGVTPLSWMKDLPCWEFARISTNIRDGAAQTPNKLFCCEITDKVKAETQQRSNIHSRDSVLISRAHRLHLEFPDPVCPSPGQIKGSPLLWGVCQSCWIPSLPLLAAPAPEPALQLMVMHTQEAEGSIQDGIAPVLQHPFLLFQAQEGFSCCHVPVVQLQGDLGHPETVLGHPWGFTCDGSSQLSPEAERTWGGAQSSCSFLCFGCSKGAVPMFLECGNITMEKKQKLQLKTKIKAMLRTALLLWLGWKGRGSIVFFFLCCCLFLLCCCLKGHIPGWNFIQQQWGHP